MGQGGSRSSRLVSLGPYTLIDRIGAGGMGAVYRALDRRSGTVVAVKVLHESASLDPAAVERFRRECHVASLLRSPYVVRTLDFGSDEGKYYLASEFIEGRSLSEVLAEGPVEPLTALTIVSEVALALDEAETRSITHRDIKPDNILVTEDGSVKVADFGIAGLAYLDGLTVTGSYLGTAAYSAPEQHRGEADARADIYSCGVVLFELLAGQRPFDAASPVELMRLHETAPPPVDKLEGYPQELYAVVLRCLEKDPARRYQHPSELVAALQAVRSRVATLPARVRAGAAAAETGVVALGETVLRADAAPGVDAPDATVLRAEAVQTPTVLKPDGGTGSPPSATVVRQPVPIEAAMETPSTLGLPLNRRLVMAAAGVFLAVVGLAGFLLMNRAGEDSKAKAEGEGIPSAAITVSGAGSTPSPSLGTASPTASATLSVSTTPAATGPTAPAVSPTANQAVPPAPTPTATPTSPPPTPTATPAPTFSNLLFSSTFSDGGAPPGSIAAGGSFGGQCGIRVIYAYVDHANVPTGTTLVGNWYYNGTYNDSNPAFASDATTGSTHYQFGNSNGLPAGTYGFVLQANGSTVIQGNVTVAC